ncbi:MAG: glutamate synthase subunit beta [Actinobacteria bacterium]|nr:glutamate synthase subunit beta [Actinomycetota bacterium]MCL6104198.1 glutamate synthase subunit beta [Actinomycetota bacterium]
MGELGGFLKYPRYTRPRRDVEKRIHDWQEVYQEIDNQAYRFQGARCMDCGVPFCHDACPLGNLIPEWNDLVWHDDWQDASQRLHATNNFPDFTGRLCPAPCEAACVLGINSDPVTIEQIEYEIAERAWESGWIIPHISKVRTNKRVAIVGSGPSGMACAEQLVCKGHEVTVLERDMKPGGLLRYGIPEFKLEKRILDRRITHLEAEGVEFRCAVEVGGTKTLGSMSVETLRQSFDAIVIAIGSTVPRDLPIPGRDLTGIYFAIDYLKPANLVQEGDLKESPVTAANKHVVIIGGGDTGADCLGTAHRQGASSIHQFEILPRPPDERSSDNPWPGWPLIFRSSSSHEEGGERLFAVESDGFIGDASASVCTIKAHRVEMAFEDGHLNFIQVPSSEFELPCDMVLLAMGFTGPQKEGLAEDLGLLFDMRGNLRRDHNFSSNVEGVFVCGDAGRGQSLIVWAIAEGRSCAAAVDRFLMGETDLPSPITPERMAMR